MAAGIGMFVIGAIAGGTAVVVAAVLALESGNPRITKDGEIIYKEAEPLTKEEWKAGLNQDMKNRGIHL